MRAQHLGEGYCRVSSCSCVSFYGRPRGVYGPGFYTLVAATGLYLGADAVPVWLAACLAPLCLLCAVFDVWFFRPR
jgi:hypothetical protein